MRFESRSAGQQAAASAALAPDLQEAIDGQAGSLHHRCLGGART